jgi:hypothetical protein
MKTMNISPLSLIILLSFISPLEIRAAESDGGNDQRGVYPHLDSSDRAYRTTGSVPVPHQAHQPSVPGSYPPSYSADDRRGSEGKTPPSGYFSDPGASPHSQFPPTAAYAYPAYYPGHPYPSYPPQAGPQWLQPAPTGHVASLPPAEPSKGHRRQRSNTFNLGDLSLETDTDRADEIKEIPVPRQLQDSVGILTTERDLLIAVAQNFLKRTKEEGKAAIESFNAASGGDASPGERRRDSTFVKLTRSLRSADKNAEKELTKKCKDLERKKEPYQERFLYLAAQCTVMKDALEEATRKLAPNTLDGAQPK